MNRLTQESRDAISKRQERERMAKGAAENRFAAEQYLIGNRKKRNRAMVALSIASVCGVLIGHSLVERIKAEATQGPILAASEKAKPITTIKPFSEKHK